MKKIFAFSVFLLFVVVANAQFADTTTLRIGGKSSSGWSRIYGSFAPWQSNDTLTGLEVGGLRYVRVFKNSQLFTTQELQIFSDGNDYTNRLNYVLSKGVVKGIILDGDHGDSIRIDGTVDFNNKILKSTGNVYIGGSGTVNNVLINSGVRDKVFSDNITVGTILSNNDVITPQNFGAKGDGVTDDTKAIQKAFDVANTTVLFPTGVYKTTDSLVLNYTSKLNMPAGSLIKSYTTSVPAVIIGYPHGTPPSTVRNMSYSVRVQRATQSDWTNRNSIGVLLRNLNYCKIDHIEASNFTVGAKALAKNGGFSYVDYQLGLFLNNEIGLWIDEETSGPTAWNNQNNYYGGWFRANSSVNVSKQRWGVVIGHEGGYRHTNNVFLGTDFELINAAAVPVLVNAGSRNVFRDYRSEGNSDTSAKVISGNGNMFYPAKCSESDTLVDLSSFASNMLECLEKTPRNKINYSPIISVDNLTNYTQYSGNDTSINIRGNLSFISREAKLVVIKTRKGITRTDNGLSFGADFPGGITTDIFNTSSLKKYMLRYSATGGAATLLIKSYNEDGVLLRDGLHVANTYTSTPTYTSTYGGAWIIGNVVPGEILLTAEDTVKSMQIIVGMGNSSSTIGIQSFKLFTYGEGTTDAGFFRQSPTDFLNTSPTAPVYGSYHRGEIILNDNPEKDSVWAWVCTSSGTFGNLSGVTGSGSNTSIKLVLSDASSVNVKEWLLVNNKPNIVTGKWGDTVYLSNPLTSTISGVSINYATPTFEPIAYVGATGGSMPGWVLDTLTAHNNRLSNVEQNDTINVTFEKNAGKDSIVLTIEGKRMAVKDSVGGGSGVSSVGLSMPSGEFSVSGSPVTSSGTLSVALKSQSANYFWGAPNGSSGAPSFRALVAADIPSLAASKITSGVFPIARLATGSPDGTKFIRDDGTLAVPSGAPLPTKPDGYLLRGTGSAGYDTATGLYYDNATKYIGIGTTAPTHPMTLDKVSTVDNGGIAMYSTTDQTTNYQRFRQYLSSSNIMSFNLEHGGSGATGYMSFKIAGTEKLSIDAQQAIFAGNFFFYPDNTYTIGRLSVSPARPSNAYIGTAVQSGAAANTTIRARMDLGPSTTSLPHIFFDKGVKPSTLSDGQLWYSNEKKLNFWNGTDSIDLLATGGVKNNVAYIDDANYTFADTISSMVLNNASADRTVNLPTASSYVGREITVRNTTKYKITFNAAVTYDKTKGSANLYPGTWVRMVARDAGWTAIEQGSSGVYTYTPTLTDSTDQINSSTMGVFNWTALEDRVHVTGRVSVSPKSSDSDVMATFYLTLPAPTTMTDQNDIGGSGSYWTVDYSNGFANVSLGGTNTAQVRFVKEPSNGRAYNINVDFWYKIK